MTVAEPGDPVLLSFAFCDKCEICKAGYYSNCNDFNSLNFGGPYEVFGKSEKPDIGGFFFGQSSFANHSLVKQCES